MANVSSSNGLEKRPKLRFPGFDEPWKETTLSALFSKSTQKNADGHITNVICNSAKLGLIPQREYFDKDIANSDNTSGYYIIRQNDFVYNPRKSSDAPYGPISSYKYAEDGIVSPLYLCFHAKDQINPLYYEWYFRSSAWHRYIYMSGDSGARHDRVSIKDDTFFAMPINLPSEQEQSKIASFLQSLDDRIAAQEKLVASLKKYKRGLLSAVFSQNVSMFSTADFYAFSELAVRRSEKYDPKCNAHAVCIELEHIEQETGRIIGSTCADYQNSIKTVCKPGDVMFGKLRPYLRKYAFVQKECVCSSEIWSLIPTDIVIPKYLFYLIQSEAFMKAANVSSGTKMPRAEWSTIAKSGYPIPSKDDQQATVDILETTDRIIVSHVASYDRLIEYKKGLLQRLFI